MTDRIDLDELTESTDEQDEESKAGDWFWRGEGDPGDERPSLTTTDPADVDPSVPSDGEARSTDGPDPGDESEESIGSVLPHVPRENKDKPVGIPIDDGGAGGGQGRDQQTETPQVGADATEFDARPDSGQPTTSDSVSDPHGGGADDMTMAFTFNAIRSLVHPTQVVADASQWTDWLGIVGHVDAHIINKFQREHQIDIDFFNGSGTSPGERLAEIDEHSMFFAERMVVVGVVGEDESIAHEADWEFVPLSTAATKAEWTLRDESP
ncbi:hypothetical protein SAMN04487948_11624 [Halogranum amylolyticum]|uniref:DUF7124 domain-containing protein n=1 Tax=Halogranum amylolyticum TaxID=660520 RepID=A0A1H8VEE8_9EURY|nr:hypothetical protein [Halogranum amylolyticum]SEP13765.1 hypothetical protein SAMN04487948_11624 [Halogranum amylolyticum]